MLNNFKKIGCIADFSSEKASTAYKMLTERYGCIDANSLDQDYDLIIAIGGDGLMLKVLHRYIGTSIPIYGINRGSVGFLMNTYTDIDIMDNILEAEAFELHPLEMRTLDIYGEFKEALAVNEVSLLRQTNQSAKLRISINKHLMLDALVCDGILVSTPAGSTAYNLAANGPIVPINSNILPLTPICPFRPRRWKGALLSSGDRVKLEVLSPAKRPVSATADFIEIRDIVEVEIYERKDISLKILFNKANNIADRLMKEQFMP